MYKEKIPMMGVSGALACLVLTLLLLLSEVNLLTLHDSILEPSYFYYHFNESILVIRITEFF